MQFSVCIVGRNEKNKLPILGHHLQSFIKAGGEVCYMDTGSKDDTVKIAQNLGFTTHEVGEKFAIFLTKPQAKKLTRAYMDAEEYKKAPWKEGDRVFLFGDARNHCATLAKKDMVLFIDCADVPKAFDYNKINEHIRNGARRFEYKMEMNGGSWNINRFYRRGDDMWDGYVHEVVTMAHKDINNRVFLPTNVLFFEHIRNNDTNRRGYTSGLALYASKNKENGRWIHYLHRDFYYAGLWKSAIIGFLKHSEMTNAYWPERNESLCLAGECYENLKKDDDAIKCYLRAIEICPNRRKPMMALCALHKRLNNHQHICNYAMMALAVKEPTDGYVENIENYTYLPHFYLYMHLWYVDQKVEAKRQYLICKEIAPTLPCIERDAKFYMTFVGVPSNSSGKSNTMVIDDIPPPPPSYPAECRTTVVEAVSQHTQNSVIIFGT